MTSRIKYHKIRGQIIMLGIYKGQMFKAKSTGCFESVGALK